MSSAPLVEARGSKLLEQVSRAVRARRYSPRTEEAYVGWVRRYVQYHGLRHPEEIGTPEVDRFLTHLAVDRSASAATQGQARAALQFLYREVLRRPLDRSGEEVVRGKTPRRLPTVMTRTEVGLVLREMPGPKRLVAGMMYGGGLRLMESLSLRVKDLDLERQELVVRHGKGGRDRVTVIPRSVIRDLEDQLEKRRALHDSDLAAGTGWAVLPGAYAQKGAQGRLRVRLAIRVPCDDHRTRSTKRSPRSLPHASHSYPARRKVCRPRLWPGQAGNLPHLPSLLRHPSPRGRIRHPNHPGTPRPQERQDHHDLHTRSQPRRPRHPKPTRRDHGAVGHAKTGARTQPPSCSVAAQGSIKTSAPFQRQTGSRGRSQSRYRAFPTQTTGEITSVRASCSGESHPRWDGGWGGVGCDKESGSSGFRVGWVG
jgi:integrase